MKLFFKKLFKSFDQFVKKDFKIMEESSEIKIAHGRSPFIFFQENYSTDFSIIQVKIKIFASRTFRLFSPERFFIIKSGDGSDAGRICRHSFCY